MKTKRLQYSSIFGERESEERQSATIRTMLYALPCAETIETMAHRMPPPLWMKEYIKVKLVLYFATFNNCFSKQRFGKFISCNCKTLRMTWLLNPI